MLLNETLPQQNARVFKANNLELSMPILEHGQLSDLHLWDIKLSGKCQLLENVESLKRNNSSEMLESSLIHLQPKMSLFIFEKFQDHIIKGPEKGPGEVCCLDFPAKGAKII